MSEPEKMNKVSPEGAKYSITIGFDDDSPVMYANEKPTVVCSQFVRFKSYQGYYNKIALIGDILVIIEQLTDEPDEDELVVKRSIPKASTSPSSKVSVPASRVDPVASPRATQVAVSAKIESTPPEIHDNEVPVMSPLPIAIFWRSETSGGVPCIEEGMEVKEGETLCVLEAAKFFNSLPAPVSGVVTRFCFKDQELVKNTQAVCYIRPNP